MLAGGLQQPRPLRLPRRVDGRRLDDLDQTGGLPTRPEAPQKEREHPSGAIQQFLPGGMRHQAKLTDQASAALIIDLKRRGMLDDTLVIWGGEFGRTSYSQGKLEKND